MFGKKKTENSGVNGNINTDTENIETEISTSLIAEETDDVASTELAVIEERKEKKVKCSDLDKTFLMLEELTGESVKTLRDDFCAYQIRKIMKKIGKLVALDSEKKGDIAKILKTAKENAVREVVVSPAYIDACGKAISDKNLGNVNVCSVIDFPFGDGDIKSKVVSIKESKKAGVDGVTVVIPKTLLSEDKFKEFKKQVKKYAKAFSGNVGAAISVSGLTDAQIKYAIKITEKTKLTSISLIFGETPYEEIKDKLTKIKRLVDKKSVKVIGNVEFAGGVIELFKLGVDEVITPNSEKIAEELLKSFSIKSL